MTASEWFSQPYLRWNMNVDCVESLPLLSVEVEINGEVIPMEGLVDSGSQDCIVSRVFAKAFKLDLEGLPEVPLTGIGGSITGRRTHAKITVIETGESFETPIIVADIPLQAILGQEGFFKRFNVLFEKDKANFSIKYVPPLDHER